MRCSVAELPLSSEALCSQIDAWRTDYTTRLALRPHEELFCEFDDPA